MFKRKIWQRRTHVTLWRESQSVTCRHVWIVV